MAIDPAANYLHFNLGLVLLRAGRDADGVAELKAELETRPDGPHAPRARQMIENPRRARENYAPSFSIVTLDREFSISTRSKERSSCWTSGERGARRA